MTLYLAADHAGYALKNIIKEHLANHHPEFAVEDLGTHSEASVHYPEYGLKAAQAVVEDTNHIGIIICGSGIGISIAANRIPGARAALCLTPEMAALAREHNNANMLALGARLTDETTALACVDTFLTTDFAGGRHEARVKMLG